MARPRDILLVGVVVCAGLASGYWLFGRTSTPRGPTMSPVAVVRIEPDLSRGDVVDGAAGQPIQFLFEIRNGSNRTLSMLRAQLPSCFRAVREPLSELAPHKATRVGFTMAPPAYGKSTIHVPVTAEGYAEPIAVLTPAVNVPIVAPRLESGPASATFTYVWGDDFVGRLQLETIEETDTVPWIVGMDILPDHVAHVVAEPVQERASPDPQFCRRGYHFLFAPGELANGKCEFTLIPRVSPSATQQLAPIPVELRVLDRIVFAPDPAIITLRTGGGPAKITVSAVDQRGHGTIEVLDFDHDLIDIRPIKSGGMQQFEIEATPPHGTTIETAILFEVGGGHERELVVQIQRAEEPAPPVKIMPRRVSN